MKFLAALLLSSCSVAGWVEDKGASAAATAADVVLCPIGLFDCGQVYACFGTPRDNPLGVVEICIDYDDQPEQLDEIEAKYGECEETPRHEGLCRYCCGEGCPARGSNAFNGMYCP